jgi:hypothetical protein
MYRRLFVSKSSRSWASLCPSTNGAFFVGQNDVNAIAATGDGPPSEAAVVAVTNARRQKRGLVKIIGE